MGDAIAAFFAGAWAFLKGMGPTLKEAFILGAGMEVQALKEQGEENKKEADNANAVLEAERGNGSRPVDGAADRLRHSGYTDDK